MPETGTPTTAALLAVVFSAAIIGLTKWDVFYNRDTGELRDFGTKEGETIFPAWMAMMAAGYLVYMIAFRHKQE